MNLMFIKHYLKTMLALLSLLVVIAPVQAGKLEPTSPPGPTMRPLDELNGAWSRKLPAAKRFVVLADFNNEAVLDKETGLVWERTPDSNKTTFDLIKMPPTLGNATPGCYNKVVAGTKSRGWRLPAYYELASLYELNLISFVELPAFHPFNLPPAPLVFWSSSSSPDNNAIVVDFSGPGNVGHVYRAPPSDEYYYWCVRGGQGGGNY